MARDAARTVFICYSRDDYDDMEFIRTAVSPLSMSGIHTWFDGDVETGANWDDSIRDKLRSANVVIFLASNKSFASKYVTENELPIAIERHKNNDCLLVVIEMGKVAKEVIPGLEKVQWLVSDKQSSKPFSWMSKSEKEEFCARLVRKLLDHFATGGVNTEMSSEPAASGAIAPKSAPSVTEDFEHPFAEPSPPPKADLEDPALWPPPNSQGGPSKTLARFLIRNRTARRLRVWFWHQQGVQDPGVPDFSARWRMIELDSKPEELTLYSNAEDFPPGPTYFVIEDRDSRSIAQVYEGWHGFAPGERVTLEVPPVYFERVKSEGPPQLIRTPAAPRQ